MVGIPVNSSESIFESTDDFRTILNDLKVKEGDDLVQEFVRIFTTRIPTDIEDLLGAIRTQNSQELNRKVHFVSTTLLTLKFPYGLSLASEIEETIDTNSSEDAFKLAERFVEYLKDALNKIS